jgi:Secretion system C-terminal sorting domain
LEVLPNGKIIIAGKAYPNAVSLLSGFLIQLDAAGNADAAQFISKGDLTSFQSSAVTADGGAVLMGTAWQIRANTSGYDPLLVKLTASGTVAWGRRYNMPGTQLAGFHVKQTPDGGYIMTGSSVVGNAHGFFVAKTNPAGDITWMKTYSSQLYERTYEIIVNSNKTYNIAGIIGVKDVNGMGNFRNNGFQTQIDSVGNLKWTKIYGDTSAVTRINSVVVGNDAGFTLVGETFGYGNNLGGGLLIHTDSKGAIGSNCMAVKDSSFVLGTATYTDSIGVTKVETGDEKSISFRTTNLTLSVNQICLGTPTSEVNNAELQVRIFPNPVKSNTVFVQVPKSSEETKLEVFDLTGRLIHTQKSNHTELIEVTLPNITTGMYLVKVSTTQGFITKKFVKE